MTLQDLGSIGEFVAAVATLATLVYLALQIRQNTREAQATSRSSVSQSFIDLLTHVSRDLETTKLVRTGFVEPNSLDLDETLRFDCIIAALFQNFETSFAQWRRQTLSDSDWVKWEVLIKQYMAQPGVQEYWSRSADYLYGCDLYNHAYWWEAHEAWEGLWQLTDKGGVQGQFLQGLIQVTASQLKIFSGQPAGPARLRETSLGYLRRARAGTDSETYMGLDLARFIESVEAYWRLAIDAAGSTPRHEPASYPYIHLIA